MLARYVYTAPVPSRHLDFDSSNPSHLPSVYLESTISFSAWHSVRTYTSILELLADSFISVRNAYTLFDYGDWVKDSSVDRNDPYVQMMSVTDKASAHSDFVKVRLAGVDTTGDAAHAILPADQGKSSPVPAGEKKKL